jgi:hypothetical protein
VAAGSRQAGKVDPVNLTGAPHWPLYTAAEFWLGACGCLPFRLIRFLDDAYRRGVLRQVGPVYEFRHVELRRYLAGPGRPG